MEVFGAVGTTADLVCRTAKLMHELRDLHRLTKTNPVQCERIQGQLKMLQDFLDEKNGLPVEQTACLGLVWKRALQDVHNGVAGSLKGLESLVKTGRSRRLNLPEFFNVGRVKSLLDNTEEECSGWLDRLCAADATLTHRQENQEILAECRKSYDVNLALWRAYSQSRTYFMGMDNVLSRSIRDVSPEQMANTFVESGNAIPSESSLSSALDRTAPRCRNLDEIERYEQDRQAFMDLNPRAKAFLKDLGSGKIGTRLSNEEKRNVATTFEKLWRPWQIDTEGISFDVRTNRLSVMLGQGSYGTVVRGTWDVFGPGNKVGGKTLRPEFKSGESFRSDFYREASLLYRLRHPSIVIFYGAHWPDRSRNDVKTNAVEEEDDDAALLVMELIDGDASSLTGKVALTERQDLTNLLLHIAEALEFIHGKNVLHLDVKPQNILLRVRNGRLHGRAKLGDFGVSRLKRRTASELSDTHRSSRRGRGLGLGTAAYMAPELFDRPLTISPDSESRRDLNARPRISAACDIYSFGVTVCFFFICC